MRTIAALYDSPAIAGDVYDALVEAGFSSDDIVLVVKDASLDYVLRGEVSTKDGAGFGALVGAVVGLGSAFMPGIGLLSVGPLVLALTAGLGAAAGALTGGLTASLLDMGLDEREAQLYAEGVHRGAVLVSLTTNEEWLEWAHNIMNRFDPVDVEERSAIWGIPQNPHSMTKR